MVRDGRGEAQVKAAEGPARGENPAHPGRGEPGHENSAREGFRREGFKREGFAREGFARGAESAVAAVVEVNVFPLKSAGGTSLTAAELTPAGLRHDREFMLVRPDLRHLSQREVPRLATLRPAYDGAVLVVRARPGRRRPWSTSRWTGRRWT
ncbi:MOSC N-terminal beta barrel domain-containing protein [Streptosporangium sp. G11]|uniref:MOSC N-terminal beta barrel domain-containing protein n=1 Tax=Streptosporangium sp. G11 TaxID=3436926 RepID=UPI003EBCD4C8